MAAFLIALASAAGLLAQPQQDNRKVGAWRTPFNHDFTTLLPAPNSVSLPNPTPLAWPTNVCDATHMALIPRGAHQGDVLVWDVMPYSGGGVGQRRVIRYSIVNPGTGQCVNHMAGLDADLGDLFCAGLAWNAEGNLLVVGGSTTHGTGATPWGGSTLAYVWEPPAALSGSGTWHRVSVRLDNERWRPSVVMLGPDPITDLDKLAVTGGTHNGSDVNTYQIWQPSAAGPGGEWQPNGPTTFTFLGPVQSAFPKSTLGDYPRARGLPNSTPGPTLVDYQVFDPPYLHCGHVRPVIANQAASGSAWTWLYGTVRSVVHATLPFGVTIAKAVLLRAGAVTHHADTNQRCVELPLTILPDTDPPTGYGAVQVTVPTKASYLLPRGYYLLYLVTNQGAVSEGAWVQIR